MTLGGPGTGRVHVQMQEVTQAPPHLADLLLRATEPRVKRTQGRSHPYGAWWRRSLLGKNTTLR